MQIPLIEDTNIYTHPLNPLATPFNPMVTLVILELPIRRTCLRSEEGIKKVTVGCLLNEPCKNDIKVVSLED